MKKLLFLLFIPFVTFGQKSNFNQSNNFKNDSISNSKEAKIGKDKRKFSLGYNFELITVKRNSYYSPRRFGVNVLNLQYSLLGSDSPIQINALASLRQNDYTTNLLNDGLAFNYAFGVNLGYNLPFNFDLVVDILFRPKSLNILNIYRFVLNPFIPDKFPIILKPSLEFGKRILIKVGYFKEFNSNFNNILDASGIFFGLRYKF